MNYLKASDNLQEELTILDERLQDLNEYSAHTNLTYAITLTLNQIRKVITALKDNMESK